MKNILKEQSGAALIITLLVVAVMSILGGAILGATTSNFKITKVDSKSQSAYYIAESGINYMIDKMNTEVNETYTTFKTSEEFYKNIEEKFIKNPIILNDFEKNKGDQPKAEVSIELVKTDENARDYKITSVGSINNTNRIVNTIISLNWNNQNTDSSSELLLSTNKFIFAGSDFNAPGKTIIISGQDANSMNGGSKINVKNIYFKQLRNGVISGLTYGDQNDPGDIYLDGDAKILSSGRTMYGNVHTSGNFIVTGGVAIHGDLYVDGNFEATGGTNIYGNLYVNGNLKIEGGATIHGNAYVFKNTYLNGGSHIKSSLNVEGNAKIVSATLEGPANINGNLELGWTPTFNKKVYYTGELTAPKNFNQGILDKCKFVETVPFLNKPDFTFSIPECKASLKEDSWYKSKAYEIKGKTTGKISKNAKWLVDNYDNTSYQKIEGEIVIISKGDIILRGEDNLNGALIAPNGTVKYTGGNFNGIVISNKEISLSGWGPANLKTLEEYFGSLNIPVDFICNGSSSVDNDSGDKIIIKSAIQER